MQAKDVIVQNLRMSDRLVDSYLADLGDADLLLRPVEGQNHIAWQLGHLISSERGMVESIESGSCPPLPEGFDAAHNREAATSDDASKFLTKQRYQELREAQRAATLAVLQSLSDDELDAPGPERMRQMAPTIGATYALIGSHVLMHVGQFVSVRRKLKKPVAV